MKETMIISRPLKTDQDFWRIHNLLVQTYPIIPFGFNWEIRRWEGRHFHDDNPDQLGDWAKNIQLWENETGDLVTAVHAEDAGDVHFQLHPDYRHLEPELLAWAEENLSTPTEDGKQRQLEPFVNEYDTYRKCLLSERGYQEHEQGGVTRHMRLGKQPLAQPQLAAGDTLRTNAKGWQSAHARRSTTPQRHRCHQCHRRHGQHDPRQPPL